MRNRPVSARRRVSRPDPHSGPVVAAFLAMDFFEHQDRARRRSRLLVFYFACAVVLIVLVINLVVALVLGQTAHYEEFAAGRPLGSALRWDPGAIATVTVITLLVIAAGSFFRWLSLRSGGRAVAEMVGARPVAPDTNDPAARRLLNIVEEMSIASGVPMPGVYLMEEENGINAFAAGYSPDDAVVAVTRGCVEKLNRDELQGVVAHEFSHILNGDMRLNIRLVAVLFGILMLAMIGRGILRGAFYARPGRSRGGKGGGGGVAVIVAVGVALLLVGYIGFFFGRLIQAAVSRQREFLADAAAVQFTRNPGGISGALKKIGGWATGSAVTSEAATQFNHCFFGQTFRSGLFGAFATHPPLRDRIKAIEPRWDGKFPEITAASIGGWEPSPNVPARPFVGPSPSVPAVPTAVLLASVGAPSAAHLEHARQLLDALPPELRQAAHEPLRAPAVVLGLLLDTESAVRARQLALVEAAHAGPVAAAVRDLAPQLTALPARLRLPLVTIALPALRAADAAATRRVLATARELIAADAQITLFEFMLEQALERHALPPEEARAKAVINYYSFGALEREIAIVLSALARVGAATEPGAGTAFAAALARVPPLQGRVALLPAAECSLDSIRVALAKLAQASPAIRKVVLAAATEAVAHDGAVEVDEGELLRAVADALDCPVPPLLPGAH
jgi:Zn-dependent protease with chaperone function